MILGTVREAAANPLGTSTVEGSFSINEGYIVPQAYARDYTIEQEMQNFTLVPTREDLRDTRPEEIVQNVTHELAHTFTKYISVISLRLEGLKKSESGKIISQPELDFYKNTYRVYTENFLPTAQKAGIQSAYLLSYDEFIARALTDSGDTLYSKFRTQVTEEFKKLISTNTRKIVSLTEYLEKVANGELELYE